MFSTLNRALEEAIKIAKTTSGTITLLTVQPAEPTYYLPKAAK